MLKENVINKYKHICLREKVNWYYLENQILEDNSGNGTLTKNIIQIIKDYREEKQLSND